MKKRSSLFYWQREKQYDVCLLQETFLTNEMILKLQKEWDGESVLNCGTQHSRDTAILFKNKHTIFNVHSSDDSRIQLVNVKIKNEVKTIVNVYAPNNISYRKTFFSKFTNG